MADYTIAIKVRTEDKEELNRFIELIKPGLTIIMNGPTPINFRDEPPIEVIEE